MGLDNPSRKLCRGLGQPLTQIIVGWDNPLCKPLSLRAGITPRAPHGLGFTPHRIPRVYKLFVLICLIVVSVDTTKPRPKHPPETRNRMTMSSSRFNNINSPADDGGERVNNVKVEILDKELLKFRFHLATLPTAQRADLLTSSDFSKNSMKTLPKIRSSAISRRITRLRKRTKKRIKLSKQTARIENSRKIKLHTCVLQMHASKRNYSFRAAQFGL